MNADLEHALSTLREYRKCLHIQNLAFWKPPRAIEERVLVSLCYEGVLEGYWDTSKDISVFMIRFSNEVDIPVIETVHPQTKRIGCPRKFDHEKIKLLLHKGNVPVAIAEEMGCSVRYIQDLKRKYCPEVEA
ncbi:hypothetical protein [Bacteroides sp.]|uniref:hypothetical protein n=1 Tax=Bacteroides sp. TaxID=29523 RepID=UPI00261BBA96|nr:hypothetical protein [Bacteroides sp.]MDD3040995.1 hypothetical protein [Bacteroides sp.]